MIIAFMIAMEVKCNVYSNRYGMLPGWTLSSKMQAWEVGMAIHIKINIIVSRKVYHLRVDLLRTWIGLEWMEHEVLVGGFSPLGSSGCALSSYLTLPCGTAYMSVGKESHKVGTIIATTATCTYLQHGWRG